MLVGPLICVSRNMPLPQEGRAWDLCLVLRKLKGVAPQGHISESHSSPGVRLHPLT